MQAVAAGQTPSAETADMLFVLLQQDNKWEFHVINSKDINAFVLPGGKVTAACMPSAGMHMCRAAVDSQVTKSTTTYICCAAQQPMHCEG